MEPQSTSLSTQALSNLNSRLATDEQWQELILYYTEICMRKKCALDAWLLLHGYQQQQRQQQQQTKQQKTTKTNKPNPNKNKKRPQTNKKVEQ